MATGTSADPSPPFPPSPRALFGKQILIGEGGKTALRKRKKEGEGGENRGGEGKERWHLPLIQWEALVGFIS